MKIQSVFKTIFSLCAAVLMLSTASAHTGLAETTPADGAKIKDAPSEIHLVFSGDVKLIKLELMGVGHEMPTSFEPNSEAVAEFVVATPGMHPGKFTVNWAAIGADGHALTDSFSFEVDPSLNTVSATP